LRGPKGENTAYGTLLGKKEPRLVKVNKIAVDADLTGSMLFLYTYDKPGIIGDLGSVLSKHAINIGGMHFGRETVGGLALCLLDVDEHVNDGVIKEIEELANIIAVKRIDLL